MVNDHDITNMSGRDLEDRLSRLADCCDIDDDAKVQRFYVRMKGKNYEIFRVKFHPELKRVYVKFSDGDRPTWKRLKRYLRELSGEYKVFLKQRMSSYKRSMFTDPLFKTSILLLLEIAQSGFNITAYNSRYETELAVEAALKSNSCVSDADDLIIFLAASREENDKSKKTRRKAFERLMLRKTNRQMRGVLQQGYFTANTKQQLRQTVSTYDDTKNVYLKDAARTLSKVLKEDEFFDLRNKEAFKIILSVFDSITVFDSISE